MTTPNERRPAGHGAAMEQENATNQVPARVTQAADSSTDRDPRPCRTADVALAFAELAELADDHPADFACPRCGWSLGAHGLALFRGGG